MNDTMNPSMTVYNMDGLPSNRQAFLGKKCKFKTTVNLKDSRNRKIAFESKAETIPMHPVITKEQNSSEIMTDSPISS